MYKGDGKSKLLPKLIERGITKLEVKEETLEIRPEFRFNEGTA